VRFWTTRQPPRGLRIATVLLAGCAQKTAATPAPPVPADAQSVAANETPAEPGRETEAPQIECGPPVRGAEAIAGPKAVLLVGEMHGTAQVPDAVGRIACHAAAAPEAEVMLGIEMAADNQDAVNTFLASDGTHDAVASLLGAPHFTADMKDGRNSEAMLQLLESVRTWKHGGANIDVVCFDAAEGSADNADARDAAMAHNLLAARKARPERPQPNRARFPMGRRLRADGRSSARGAFRHRLARFPQRGRNPVGVHGQARGRQMRGHQNRWSRSRVSIPRTPRPLTARSWGSRGDSLVRSVND
jgi:hypothetical protein